MLLLPSAKHSEHSMHHTGLQDSSNKKKPERVFILCTAHGIAAAAAAAIQHCCCPAAAPLDLQRLCNWSCQCQHFKWVALLNVGCCLRTAVCQPEISEPTICCCTLCRKHQQRRQQCDNMERGKFDIRSHSYMEAAGQCKGPCR